MNIHSFIKAQIALSSFNIKKAEKPVNHRVKPYLPL